ncbi:EamA family transporter [Clostridium taeniosporum]|uniref:EamA/RhaT family transporter n=1 Tax=Clostridium taeniosporum TaxID=394958 RepID=A0A1D7XLW5_9CLOT|nr:DMT family transporter [Clostridium taeniosporum]AOR24170.1 EamA/RhaT family transporter [Clostridium taeniosporum]
MNLFKNSLFVFLGACCYGILSTIVKLAYNDGFVFKDVVMSQFLFGWLTMLIIMIIFSRKKIKLKQFISLALIGISTCATTIFYYLSLESIQASFAVVLLFQFTWIGLLIESIVDRKLPSKVNIISIIILFVGTILASGLLNNNNFKWNFNGILFGFMAALSYALFIFFSGRVETGIPSINRSFSITTGALIVAFTICPNYFFNGCLLEGIWKYGIILGVFGAVLPVLFFAIGTPKLTTGLSTILGAGELPIAIIASIIILKEEVSIIKWIGVIIILIGVAVPQLANLKNDNNDNIVMQNA